MNKSKGIGEKSGESGKIRENLKEVQFLKKYSVKLPKESEINPKESRKIREDAEKSGRIPEIPGNLTKFEKIRENLNKSERIRKNMGEYKKIHANRRVFGKIRKNPGECR